VLERVAGTVTPPPVLAVAQAVDVALDDVAGASMVVVCVDIRDPGNLGTVVRTAEAAGVGAMICCDGSVDVYNPKCVRASAGSLFHTRIVTGGEPVRVLATVAGWGLRRLGTRAWGGTPYHRADLREPTALVLGNEAHGLPPALTGALDGWVTIPMAGRAESLNVGMAAAVLCFEAARQRAGAELG
jgi:TrmH family RNA methyltransferase